MNALYKRLVNLYEETGKIPTPQEMGKIVFETNLRMTDINGAITQFSDYLDARRVKA